MLANKIDNGIRRDPQLSGALEALRPKGSRFDQLFETVTSYAEAFGDLASGISAANEGVDTVVAAVKTAPSSRHADAQLRCDCLEEGLLRSGTAE